MNAPARDWEPAYAARASRMQASEIRELLKLLERPEVISFAGGIPDASLFPRDAAAQAYAAALADPKAAASGLQYSVSEGYPPLRAWIAGHMRERGVDCDPDNIVITSGSQQALDFLARLLLSPGDTALVTWPTYLGALQAFNAYEPNYERLNPLTGNRTATSYREAACRAAPESRVKFAYVVPDFANPTGQTLDLAARQRLLELAIELDIPVIEDAAYTALRFDGEDVPPVQALDVAQHGHIDRARTIYCGTFSKTISPGLRIGWICAARPIVRRLVLIKQASDLNSCQLNQMVMDRLAREVFDDQVTSARQVYRHRRDCMLAALSRYMPAGVSWTRPDGGLFVWLTAAEEVDTKALLPRAVEEAGVAYVPGSAFYADDSGANSLRLSYSLADESQIEAGIGRLADLLRSF